MKKSSISLFVKLSQPELDNLTRETKETLDIPNCQVTDNKRFTSAELWNIHKRARTWNQRRYL